MGGMAFDFGVGSVVHRHEERHRVWIAEVAERDRHFQQRTGANRRPSWTALEPMWGLGPPIPEKAGQPPRVLPDREPDRVRPQELQRELIPLGEQIEQRPDA